MLLFFKLSSNVLSQTSMHFHAFLHEISQFPKTKPPVTGLLGRFALARPATAALAHRAAEGFEGHLPEDGGLGAPGHVL